MEESEKMVKIGVAQIDNSISTKNNFEKIKKSLLAFERSDVDLILFPECSLSGFSAKMKECTYDSIRGYLQEVEEWAKVNGKLVVLPTALKEDDKVYNSGFLLGPEGVETFFKLRLTDSEKKFFSIPKENQKKVFEYNGYRFSILICFEAQLSPWEFFKEGDVDFILWPGYWGWKKGDSWIEKNEEDEENLIFKNMNEWKVPLIQSNFSKNCLNDHRKSGPHGLSMFVNRDNKLFGMGEYDLESLYQINITGGEISKLSKIANL